MQAIIVYKQRNETVPQKLPTGETVLERQIRTLANVGVRKFVVVTDALCMNNARKETEHKYFSKYQFSYVVKTAEDNVLESAGKFLENDDTFVIFEDFLFDEQLPAAMLSSEHTACTVIDKTGNDTSWYAKMGMKEVEKVGSDLAGVGCFSLIPVFFLQAEYAQMWCNAAASKNDFVSLNSILSELHLRTIQAKDYALERFTGNPALDANLFFKLQKRLYTQQREILCNGAILETPNILHELGVQKPLLLCDDSYRSLQIDIVLKQFCINAFEISVVDAITQSQAESAAEQFVNGEHDGIISIGGNAVINAAKAVKLCLAEKNSDVVFSPIAHIMIPTSVMFGLDNNTSVSISSGDQVITKSHPCLLPDTIILDKNMQTPEEEEVRTEACFTAASLAINSLWNKYSMQESSKLASSALRLLIKQKRKYLLYDKNASAIALAIHKASQATQLVELNAQYQEKCAEFLETTDPEEAAEYIEEDTESVEPMESTENMDGEETPIEENTLNWVDSKLSKAARHTRDSLEENTNKSKRKKHKKRHIMNIVKSKLPWLFKRIKYVCNLLRFYWCEYRYGLDTQMVLFESAHGSKCNCNPRAIYEAMLQDSEYLGFTFVWSLKNPNEFSELRNNPRTILVKQGTNAYIRRCAQAKYWVSNYNMPSYLRKGKDHVWIHTWHGKPIKRIGCDFNNTIRKDYAARDIKRNYTRASKQMTFLLSAAPAFTKHMANAYNLPALKKTHIVAETGYPRNDFLFTYTQKDILRIKLDLRIPLEKKVILYTPTWRVVNSTDTGHGFVYESHLDLGAFSEQLGEDYVILFRAHPYEAASVDFSKLGGNVLNVCEYPEVNDLYIISDLMISDYSGTIFDYANLRRPMVYYMYDRDEYVNEQTGVYFDLDTLPGPIVYKEEDLAQTVKEHLKNFVYDETYQLFNQTYNLLDGPYCGRDTARMLIPKTAAKSASKQRKDKLREFLQNTKVRVTGLFRGMGITNNPNTKAFAAYKDRYKGERCFMVGNGPSLTLADLDNIRNEYSFCCNLIYKIFDLTLWRPKFYCITDLVFTSTIAKELAKNITVPFFTTKRSFNALKEKPAQTVYVNSVKRDDYRVHKNMKQYYIPANATVMTFMIELAMYMGFKEIYLIGVDCSNGFVGKDSHFIEDYENDAMMQIEYKRAGRALGNKHLTLEEFGKYRTDRSMFAYAKLRKYADKHGIKIYNATRGGYLEEFERVNLDDLEFKTDETAIGTDA